MIQASHGIGSNIGACTPRNIVDQEGEWGFFADRAVMLENTFLSWFIVIGADEKSAVCAGFFGKLSQADSFCGII